MLKLLLELFIALTTIPYALRYIFDWIALTIVAHPTVSNAMSCGLHTILNSLEKTNAIPYNVKFALALIVLLPMGLIAAQLGYPVANLFDSNNTLYFIVFGLLAGTLSTMVFFTYEMVREFQQMIKGI